MENVKTGLKRIALVAVAVLLVGVVGRMDYEDEVAQAKHCKEMVAAGMWPAGVCK